MQDISVISIDALNHVSVHVLPSFPTESDVLSSTAKLESHSASTFQIQKGFNSTVHAGHAAHGLGPKICQVDRKCERCFHIKQRAEGWCLCIVKEGARMLVRERRAERHSHLSVDPEECGHRRAAFLCVHTWVCEV